MKATKYMYAAGPQKKLFYVGIPHISGKNSNLQHSVKTSSS